jgi:hypothetical protein
MRWPGTVEELGKNRIADRVLARNPGGRGRRQIKRPRRRWNDNIALNLN